MTSLLPMWTLFAAILFFLLTPGVLLSLPSKSSTVTKAFVHAIVYGILFYVVHIFMLRYFGIH